MPLLISDALRGKLNQLRETQLQRRCPDEIVAGEDVVQLTSGFGPAIYLGFDGRIVYWNYMDDEAPRVTEDLIEIAMGLVIGAKSYNLEELVDLLPARPVEGVVCPLCIGKRWIQLGVSQDGKPGWIVCWECHGLGWINCCDSPTD